MQENELRFDDALLRRALLANAAFSGASALVMAVWAGPLGALLGTVSPTNLRIIAAVLALFCLDLLHQTRADPVNPLRALGATLGDLAWVAGSAVLLLLRPDALSSTGLAIVAAVAVVVLGMALAQLAGLRRWGGNRRGETDARSMYVLTRRLDAPASAVWRILGDLARIGDFSAVLQSVEVDETDGVTVRTCSDTDGNRWSEEVVSMDDRERALSLRFVTEADDFPFPMTTMIGGWRVTPRGEDACDLTLWYEYTMKGGLLGEIGAAVSAPTMERRMGPVLDAMGEAARREGASGPVPQAGTGSVEDQAVDTPA